MNCGPPDHLAPCSLDVNWDRPMGLSTPAGSLAVEELVGRLGSICNPTGEISPQSQYMSNPLNSPPKFHLSAMEHHHHHQQLGRGGLPVSPAPVPHLAPFSADPGFVERAARFSCFGGSRNYGGLAGQFGLREDGKLSRVSSCHSLRVNGPQLEVGNAEFGNAREESSASDPISTSESNARKRKAVPKVKGKDPAISPTAKNSSKMAEGEDSNAKRCRSAENTKTKKDEVKPKIEQNGGASSPGDDGRKQGKENNAKTLEPLKDYIHVRARRGQATDSHSLAERVRREKISERMKLLQDLVPGCNKVTGKALMLDEIINYVQSLQRQVEFLSMKLASVNPTLDFNVDSILRKDMHQTTGPLPTSVYPLETSAVAFPYAHQPQQGTPLQCVVTNGLESQCSVNPLELALHRTISMQLPSLDGFGDATSQIGTFWEDDLQNVVQMGFGQSQEMAFSSQGFHGTLPATHEKIEL